jgi:hypothetical protein
MDTGIHVKPLQTAWNLTVKVTVHLFGFAVVSKNWKHFTTNHDAHNLRIRHRNDLYLPTSTLTLYQKRVYYRGIKLFNNLSRNLKEVVGLPKQFKIALRRYLVTHCFYDLVEYYQANE